MVDVARAEVHPVFFSLFFCSNELKADHHYCFTAVLPGKRDDLMAVHCCETCYTGDGGCCENGRGDARSNSV